MAAKKVGELIREARTKAGLSQEALAKLIDGVSASDIGKAERGEKELTQAALKAIAKATGVTQKSLLEAPKGGSPASKTSGKTASAKKTDSEKTTTGKTSSKTSGKTSGKTSTSKKSGTASVELTSAEKTLLSAYRKADAETQKAALRLLKGEGDNDFVSTLMGLLGNLGK